MATEVTSVLVTGRTSPPGQAVTLTDHATNTVIGSTVSDAVTGVWSIPCPFGIYFEGTGAGVATGAAAVSRDTSAPGTAGGAAGASGSLSQDVGLAGSAGGVAGVGGDAGAEVEEHVGTAAGVGAASGTVSQNNISTPSAGATVSTSVTFSGTATTYTGAGNEPSAELWDEA